MINKIIESMLNVLFVGSEPKLSGFLHFNKDGKSAKKLAFLQRRKTPGSAKYTFSFNH